jgi:hypothetical protein
MTTTRLVLDGLGFPERPTLSIVRLEGAGRRRTSGRIATVAAQNRRGTDSKRRPD